MSDNATRSLSDAASTPNAAPVPTDPPELPSQIGRYAVEGEIARGGMGVVLRASDPDFGRTLAVKVLLDDRRDDEAAIRRFLDEARLCGQLQHPGIPPVHEMGTLPDGRPFFAMKLVKGETLAALLAARPRGADATPLANDLPRFLAIFEQLCQTVAYAHSRGILHRDLKPANVMVGAFGEVQVMDWGLAKVLGGEHPSASMAPAASTLYTLSGPGSPEQTAPGSILGTPAFMPPEQARGQVDHLDERADVFALGAVVCVILTGRPPYEGDSRPVVKQAAEGDLTAARARLANCGADGELVRLALACLSFQPSERPRDAAAVAEAVAAYRAGVEERLRQAEIARAQAEVRVTEERRRRRVLLALVASVVLFVMAVGGSAWWWQRDRDARLARTRAEASPALSRAAQWRAEAGTFRGRGVAETEKAATLLQQARTAVEQAESALAAGFPDESLRREVAEARTAADSEYAEAKERLALARKEAAFLAALEKARERRGRIVKGTWGISGSSAEYARAFGAYGRDVTRLSPTEVVTWLRGLPKDRRELILTALYDWWWVCGSTKPGPQLWTLLEQADDDPWRAKLRQAVQHGKVATLLQLLEEAKSQRLSAVSCEYLAVGLTIRGQRLKAIEFLRGARLTHPRDFWIPFDLGNFLGKSIAANAADEATSFWGPLPGSRSVNGNRAASRETVLAEMVSCYQTALALRPDSPAAWNNLGIALLAQGKVEEAIAAYRQAIALDPEYAYPHDNLGEALHIQGKVEEAITAFRQAVACDPNDAESHYHLGLALQQHHQVAEAIIAFRQAIKCDPKHAKAYNNLGGALMTQNKVEEAVAAYRQSITWDPTNAKVRSNLGHALRAQNKVEEAITAFRQAIALDPRYAPAHYGLGSALYGQNKVEEAIRSFRQAIVCDPKDAKAHYNLGSVLSEQHKLDEAIAALSQAVRLQPTYPEAHCNLGWALRKRGRFAEALENLRRGHALGSRQAGWKYPSGQWVRDCERLVGLETRIADLLQRQAKPNNAAECLELIEVCRLKQQYAAAARFAADAFAAEPARAENLDTALRYNAACYAALAGCGQSSDFPREDKDQAALRRQALAWLRADLTLLVRQVLDGNPRDLADTQALLRHWQGDPDLIGVRHPWALLRLSAEERGQWRKLWADVDDLLKKVNKTGP